jgi:hypothetical protein
MQYDDVWLALSLMSKFRWYLIKKKLDSVLKFRVI